ncbi:MAG: TRAP transporter large permease subunit [Alphaproteobacteria bacterium]|nr:TRAP transporter large permease subunit [Alphaproteobacteria bacterium]
MFPALFGLVFLGVPVSFSLIVVGAGFGLPFFGATLGQQLLGRLLEVASGFAFASVPAFIFMGALLERAGIAERLFAAMRVWLGALPGGLAVATIAMAAVFAATTGIIGAVEVVIGMMAIGPMLRAGYNRGLIAGTITSGGSLGTIIPPSVTCVIYGLIAQVPVGDLLAGILLPGLLMVALFLLYILGRCILRPQDGPVTGLEERCLPLSAKLRITLSGLVPAALLIAAVLGSIFAGIASPTEAAAVGALGAALLAAAYGRLTLALVHEALEKTATVTAMIMLIVFGGTLFSSVFYVHGGGALIQSMVGGGQVSPTMLIAIFLGIVFLAGFVLDWATIVLLCVPIFSPLLKAAGIDPLWFGVLVLVCIQTSYLTPPMAPALFYLRSVAPPEITYGDMCRGVIPFVICQLITLAAVAAFPWVATWLPGSLKAF